MIGQMLKEGYGIEDISIRTGLPVDEVRFAVALLRESGSLKILLRGNRRALPQSHPASDANPGTKGQEAGIEQICVPKGNTASPRRMHEAAYRSGHEPE